jgi:hypothetical protein
MAKRGERDRGHGDRKSGSQVATPKLADLGVTKSLGKAQTAQATMPVAARGILTRINPEGLKALRHLDQDTTVQALMIEAANDLLRKYRRRPVAQTAPRS